jgi:hypothetical protein
MLSTLQFLEIVLAWSAGTGLGPEAAGRRKKALKQTKNHSCECQERILVSGAIQRYSRSARNQSWQAP